MSAHRTDALGGLAVNTTLGREAALAAEEEHLANVDLARLKASIKPDELVDDAFRHTVSRLVGAALVLDDKKQPLPLDASASRIASVAGSGPGTYLTLANWMLIMAAGLFLTSLGSLLNNAAASGPGQTVGGVFVPSSEPTARMLKYSLPNHQAEQFGALQGLLFVLSQLVVTVVVLVANVRIRNTDQAADTARLSAADYAVHVRNFPPLATPEDLAKHFSQFGEVEYAVLGYRFGVIADEAHRLLDVEHEIGRLKAVLEVHGQQAEVRLAHGPAPNPPAALTSEPRPRCARRSAACCAASAGSRRCSNGRSRGRASFASGSHTRSSGTAPMRSTGTRSLCSRRRARCVRRVPRTGAV